ncbi:3'-5' exonuclease [Aspergillus fischeri NRRL 181]|uniref:Gfd2/YDR514C-like C-terminal domain-containing protein n=1 Tax=Neosartorya fischeri (strain ATCC 1020 / DSM 3700 / CBS 544.65 / FGSC A1164 / JCM 1740 / NRRL 181 / WB 181) TaxID=331117 RepID=A1D6M8_NEOFI|nr:conserved hypothetical protein [Aspergillus fischeri NRRL 181]EAW21372.1 conserved hypothetical protein [Aspergillus fischeri NRRL 181]
MCWFVVTNTDSFASPAINTASFSSLVPVNRGSHPIQSFEMDRTERLKLLFSEDESLLRFNTRLNAQSIPDPKATEEASSTVVTQEEVQPEKDDKDSESNTKAEENAEGLDKSIVQETDQCNASTQTPDTKYLSHEQEEPSTPLDGFFCPLMAISKYPYKFVRKELSQTVASRFFNGGKFWQRVWDLYYVHVSPQLRPRPLLLVPAAQVRKFIQEINCELEVTLSIPEESEMGMLLDFNLEGVPQPTFVGQCTSREMKDELEATIPLRTNYEPPTEMDESRLAYEQMIEHGIDASKSKSRSKASKAKKQQIRLQAEIELVQALKKMRCYLALQPYHSLDLPELIDERSWEEKRNDDCSMAQSLDDTSDTGIPRLDLNNPAMFPFWKEPIFISVDVECNERCLAQVTEVGISTLDTVDLVGIPPGGNAENWTSRIRSRHLRVREYGHIVNCQYVTGCPGSFEFGESEWVSKGKLADVVQACFQPPYSFGMEDTDGVQLDSGPEHMHQKRNLILVGHNTSMDVKYLAGLGIPVFEDVTTAFVERIDTAELYRIIRSELNQRSLASILGELGIIGWNLHNAGNDARYTLEALVRMICRDTGEASVAASTVE